MTDNIQVAKPDTQAKLSVVLDANGVPQLPDLNDLISIGNARKLLLDWIIKYAGEQLRTN